MKKILTASLVAIMAVTAANAEIASVGYVDGVVDGLDVSAASGTGNVVTSVTQENGKVVVAREFNAASNAELTTLAGRVTTAEGTLSGLTSGDASVDKKIEAAVSALENGSIKNNADDISALQGTVATLETKTDANAKLTEAKGYTDTKVGEVDTALTSYKTEMTTTLGDYAKTTAVTSAIATAKGEAIDTAAADATTKANAAQQAAIDAIGAGVLTVNVNGVAAGTFSANATDASSVNIAVPTTVAQLTDAGDYVKDTELTTTLGSYVTSGALEQKGYATTAYADAKVDNAVIDDDDAATKTTVAPSVAQVAVYVDTAETDAVKAAKDYTDSKFANSSEQIQGLSTRVDTLESSVPTEFEAVNESINDINTKLGALAGKQIPANPCTTGKCSLVWDAGANAGTGAFVWEAIK